MKRSSSNNFEYIMSNDMDNGGEFIPLLSGDIEDDDLNVDEIGEVIPLLPLRNSVLFPKIVMPIHIGRQKSINLIKEVYRGKRIIGTVSQKESSIDEPTFNDLFLHGTIAKIIKILEMPDGSTSVIIQGMSRMEVTEFVQSEPYLTAKYKILPENSPINEDKEYDAIVSSLRDLSIRIIELSNNIPAEAAFAVKNIENNEFLINFICSNSELSIKQKLNLIKIDDLKKRGIILLEYISQEVSKLELKDDIQLKVKQELDRQQKEYFLNQQIKTIQDELGGDPHQLEIEELKEKAKKKKWNKEVEAIFEKEIKRLGRTNPASPEFSIQLNYIQTLLDLPWNVYTKDNFDLKRAQNILDRDHYGLDKVKERILEYLAVLKLKGDLKSPILCLYGPPGVGKTSLGKSIAKALNRKYIRMSLGGLHDEAEIRGHRKTYIGALPGRIIQNIKKAKSSNPVFILDEVDKVGADFRGDPSSALLEVLDPEQNSTFHDNYLETEFDLSKVMFIATANSLSSITPALLDRMELLNVTGYVLEEKLEIAKIHLIPKQLKQHGLRKNQFRIDDEVLDFLIEHYTKESGVRMLDKVLASLIRKIAKRIAFGEKHKAQLSKDSIVDLLGVPVYQHEKYLENEKAGIVTGLAWTAFGGEILYIESSLSRGNGKLTITGNLGQVMKESAIIALEYIKSNYKELGISPKVFKYWNIHIHVPEGAIPKDGPSAGITMASSLASLFTQRKVKPFTAMTGEITLSGRVLPVGGIKEKILAAKRAGIKEIILSEDNKKDIDEIKDLYKSGLDFHYIADISEVLNIILLDEKVKKTKQLIPKEKKNNA